MNENLGKLAKTIVRELDYILNLLSVCEGRNDEFEVLYHRILEVKELAQRLMIYCSEDALLALLETTIPRCSA